MAAALVHASTEYFQVDAAPLGSTPSGNFSMFAHAKTTDFTVAGGDGFMNAIGFFDASEVAERECLAFDTVPVLGGASADRYVFFGSGHTTLEATLSLSDNNWHSVLGTANSDNTNRAIYFDGANKGTQSDVTSHVNIDRVTVGRFGDSTPNGEWDGSLAETAIWNTELDDVDAAVLGAGFSPLFVRPNNLVFYDRMVILDAGLDSHDERGQLTMVGFGTPTTDTDHPRITYPSQEEMAFIAAGAPAQSIVPSLMRRYAA